MSLTTPTRYQWPPLEDAKRQYVELYGSALVLNTYLKIALLCVSLVAVGLVALNVRTQRRVDTFKPLVIRIDDVGRAQAVQYDALDRKSTRLNSSHGYISYAVFCLKQKIQ